MLGDSPTFGPTPITSLQVIENDWVGGWDDQCRELLSLDS